MTWQEFKKYIQNKYLQTELYNSTKLNQTAQQKFKTVNIQELEQALADLFSSIDDYFEYGDEKQFHDLPALQDLSSNDSDSDNYTDDNSDNITQPKPVKLEKTKTWKELFPNREEAFFGKTTNNTPYSQPVWNTLSKIYTDWSQQETKAEQLKTQSKQWEKQFEKLMLEYLASKAQKYAKKKGLTSLKTELKRWLTNYESLDKENQEELKSEKESVQKVYELLTQKTVENQSSQTDANSGNNWDWNQVFKYSVVGLVILAGIGLVLKLIKGK